LHDVALAADSCVSYDIHAIDVAMWILGKRPVAALGNSARMRPNAVLDGRDVVHATMEMEDGLVWTHMHQTLANEQRLIPTLCTKVFGTSANATLPYAGTGFILGSDVDMSVDFNNTYEAGVQRNVARFYTNLVEGHFENPAIQRTVDGHLTAILIREAAFRHKRLTMAELLAENKKLDYDLTGFKV
jgi:predicted dehydrogenase